MGGLGFSSEALGAAVDLAARGGPVVAVLLALSVAALGIVLAKAWEFAALGDGGRRAAAEATALMRAGRIAEAVGTAKAGRGPVAEAAALAIRGLMRGLDPAAVREEAERYGFDAVETLRHWLRPLETIAALAPLLGLFGTVLGMIGAFAALEAAGAQVDAATFAGGVWEALLTTAVGLAVAIPAVAAVNAFERRAERIERAVSSALAAVFGADLDAPDLPAAVPLRRSA